MLRVMVSAQRAGAITEEAVMPRARFGLSVALLSLAAPGLSACGAPAQPKLPNDLGGAWVVQQIAGASLGEDVEIYIEIDANSGAMSGFTGCNPFSAPVTAYADALAIGPIQEQLGECASAEAATDEARLLGVLPFVHRFRRRGNALELLPQERGDALVLLRIDDFATLTQPARSAPSP